MRKVSKSRADDDVVSSTNGSVLNDDQAEANKPTDDEKAQDSEDTGDYDKSDDEALNSKATPKKSKGKRGRKKKADKKDKKHREEDDDDENGTEEEYEVCICSKIVFYFGTLH